MSPAVRMHPAQNARSNCNTAKIGRQYALTDRKARFPQNTPHWPEKARIGQKRPALARKGPHWPEKARIGQKRPASAIMCSPSPE
jgi:hypothetical protein